MGEFRLVLVGEPYPEPRYYGRLSWSERDVYLRHPHGGKDSRHADGRTYLTSSGPIRSIETRVPTSDVTRELVNYLSLFTAIPEPPPLRGAIRDDDFVLPTDSAGTAPRLAVEIVSNDRVPGVLEAWGSHSTAPNRAHLSREGEGPELGGRCCRVARFSTIDRTPGFQMIPV